MDSLVKFLPNEMRSLFQVGLRKMSVADLAAGRALELQSRKTQ
jgi:hypothetical protein